MTLTLEIPDSIAPAWKSEGEDVARAILEDSAVEAYRQGRLSAFQIRQLLGHASRWETEDFLSAHGAWPGLTEDEAREDSRRLSELLRA
jgi:hypothetical protein